MIARLRPVPFDLGPVHFVGIGGIGMSGIAEVMHNLGYKVQGTDMAESYVVEGLRKRGIPVMIGHDATNLGDAAVVVTSTAVSRKTNPEVEAAFIAHTHIYYTGLRRDAAVILDDQNSAMLSLRR